MVTALADGSLLDGISAVTGLDEYEALDVVDRLVGRSLLVAASTPLGTRYRQLETIRQFAEDRLVALGRLDEARDRHLEWVRALAATMDGTHDSARTGADMIRLAAEVGNVRVAVRHAQRSHRAHLAHEIVANAATPILARPAFEVIGWFDPVDASDAMLTEHGAAAMGVVAMGCVFTGDIDRLGDLASAFPPEVRTDPAVFNALGFYQLLGRGDLAAAEAILAELGPAVPPHTRSNVELNIENVRLLMGVDDATRARLAELEQLAAHLSIEDACARAVAALAGDWLACRRSRPIASASRWPCEGPRSAGGWCEEGAVGTGGASEPRVEGGQRGVEQLGETHVPRVVGRDVVAQ